MSAIKCSAYTDAASCKRKGVQGVCFPQVRHFGHNVTQYMFAHSQDTVGRKMFAYCMLLRQTRHANVAYNAFANKHASLDAPIFFPTRAPQHSRPSSLLYAKVGHTPIQSQKAPDHKRIQLSMHTKTIGLVNDDVVVPKAPI